MFDLAKRAFFVRLLGEDATAALEAGLAFQSKRLEGAGVSWKSLDVCLGGICPQPAAPAAAPAAAAHGLPASPYVAQLRTPTPTPATVAGVATAVAELRHPYAHPAGAYIADLAERGAVQS